MEDQQKDIFNLQLNKESAGWILRFCRITQLLILFSILSGLVSIIHNFLRITDINTKLYTGKPLWYEYLYHPYFFLCYDVIWMIQVYIFWRFRGALKEAVTNLNNNEFNSSFYHLLKITRLSLILSIMGLISASYSLFLHLKYFD